MTGRLVVAKESGGRCGCNTNSFFEAGGARENKTLIQETQAKRNTVCLCGSLCIGGSTSRARSKGHGHEPVVKLAS